MLEKLKRNKFFSRYSAENISLLLLGIYSLSFINYYIYYKSFEIPIFNYIGLNDLIFFALEYIFKIILIIFICEVLLFLIFGFIYEFYEFIIIIFVKRKAKLYLKASKKNRNRISEVFWKNFDQYLNQFRFSIVFLSMLVIPFTNHILILFPTLLVYMFYYMGKVEKEDEFITVLLKMLIGIIVISMIVTTIANSYNKRFEKDNYTISFKENTIEISTDKKLSNYNYLGETSSHIFLFDTVNNESRIFSKSNITDIKIKNTNEIDKYVKKIKNMTVIKLFIEMNNQK